MSNETKPELTPAEKARRYHQVFPQVPEATILHWLTLDGMSERSTIFFLTVAKRGNLDKVSNAVEEFARRKREEARADGTGYRHSPKIDGEER